MIYTNVYELVCSIVKADPQTTISSSNLQWGQGWEILTHSSGLAENTEQSKDATQAIMDCLGNHLFNFCAPGTVDFTLHNFSFTDQGLTTQATWYIESHSEFADNDFLEGQQDVWGPNIQVIGVSDFETIRAALNATGEFKFELILDEKGWVKNNVTFRLMEEAAEMVDPDVLAPIKDHLPALNDAIRTRLMNLALQHANNITDTTTSEFLLDWSSGNSLVYMNEEFGEDINNTRRRAKVTDHITVEPVKRLFDFPCDCFYQAP
jgi:hypothetical protein